MGWEERLTDTQRDAVAKACDDFAGHGQTDDLYDALVVAGMTPEEADEYVNLMIEGY